MIESRPVRNTQGFPRFQFSKVNGQFSRRAGFLTLALYGLISIGLLRPASGQEETPPPAPLIPVVIFNIASTERALNDISQMFSVAGRPDMVDVIEGFLGDKVGGLKGLDRTRPIGYMLFLEPTLPPRPRMVMYLPVSNEADLVNTLRLGPSPITEVGEHEYEVENRGRRGKTPLKFQNDYAFLLPTGEGFLKDQEYPDPRTICSSFAARYDASFTIRLRGIPPLIREVFSTFITQQFSGQMQKRDNERDEAYEFRRAQGMGTMSAITRLIRDGEEITIGLDSTADGRRAVLEITTQARADSEYAKYLTGMAGTQSYFTPLQQDAAPLQVCFSWNLDKHERETFLGYLKSFRLLLKRELAEANAATIDNFVNALEATVNQNHMDGMIQFVKRPGNELVMVGGLRVAGSETVGTSLREVIAIIKEKEPEDGIELDFHQHQGVTLHKLPVRNDDATLNQIYGGRPDLFMGTGPGTLWFAFGARETLQAVDHAIEVTAEAPPRADVATAYPIQMILHASSWLKYINKETINSPRRAFVVETLNPENDSIRLEVVPMENGVRASLRFDEGFVHVIGGLFAMLYDETQL